MPTYTGPGLLAGPYWDALEPDPANSFRGNNDAARGLLGALPAWAEPMTPSWPAVDFLPWQRFIPIVQAPDDSGPLLPPGLRKPPRLPRADDPFVTLPLGAAYSGDTPSSWAQPESQFDNSLGTETSRNPGAAPDLFDILRTLPFETGPYDRDFAASGVPTTFPVRDSVDTLSALAAADDGEPNIWPALASPSSGVLDPTGLTYGPQPIATQAAYEGEPSSDPSFEAEAGSGVNDNIGELDDEMGSSDRDQDYPNLAQAPNNKQQPPQRRPAPPPPSMSAVRTGRAQIMIASEDGTVEVRTGGTPAWRNHNPGNLIDGDFSKRHGAVGTDGDFAIFPNDEIGRRAAIANLRTRKYQALSLDKAIETWASRPTDPVAKYQEFVRDKMGLPGNTPLSSLTQPEIERLYDTIRKFERSTPGTVTRYAR